MTLVSLVLSGCGGDSAEASGEAYRHQVRTVVAQLQSTYTVERRIVGRVEARQRAEIGFELAGKVAEIRVDEGAVVDEGALLARLDSQLLDVERDEIAARQQAVMVQKQLAQLELQRQRALAKKGFSVEQRVDELQAQIATQEAQYRQLQALLSGVDTRIQKSFLVAPYRALVAERYLDQGSVVQGGQPLFRLLENAGVEARVGVPQQLISALRVGDEVAIERNGGRFAAVISSVGGHLDPATNTIPVRLALPEQQSWSDGDVIYLMIQEPREEPGFWLPLTALHGSVRGMWELYVPVVNERGEGVLERRSVELLYSAGSRVYVRGALKDGEPVVSEGVHRLAPGQIVRLEAR